MDRATAADAVSSCCIRVSQAQSAAPCGARRSDSLARMKKLTSEDRLRLMKFVCSFVWADLEVKESERKFVTRMAKKLHLDASESALVQAWLEVPPRAEDVDPTTIPREHRQMFLDTIRDVITADGEVARDEWENLALFEQLLGKH